MKKDNKSEQISSLFRPSRRAKKLIIFFAIILLLTITFYLFVLKNSEHQKNTELFSGPNTVINKNSEKFTFGSQQKTTRLINPQIAPDAIKKASRLQSFLEYLIPPVYAESGQSAIVYKLTKLAASADQNKTVARAFGFTNEPKQVGENEFQKATTFYWENDTSALNIGVDMPLNGFIYQSYPQPGDLSSDQEAVNIATEFLKSKGMYTEDIVNSEVLVSNLDLFTDMLNKDHPKYNSQAEVKTVFFSRHLNDFPITMDQSSLGMYGNLMVSVGPNNHIVQVFDPLYGYTIDKANTFTLPAKSLEDAVKEFKQTGGAIERVDLQPGKSWGTDQKLEIKDAIVTSIEQAYILTDKTGFSYPEDMKQHEVSLIFPVWVFKGTGKLYGEGFSGDDSQFVSYVYGIKEGDKGVFKISELKTSLSEYTPQASISATFNFAYSDIANTSGDSIPIPLGIRYIFSVMYPDGSEARTNDVIRESNYGETITFNAGEKSGDLKIRVSAVDFPTLSQERIVKIMP